MAIGHDDSLGPVDLSEHRQVFRRQFQEMGTDAVAFYAPYHLWGDVPWGIYFVGDSLLGYAEEVRAGLSARGTQISQLSALRLLRRTILAHERFHFRVEFAATHCAALVGGKTIYPAYFELGRSGGMSESALLEEAVATAQEVHAAGPESSQLSSVLREILESAPPGYRDYGEYLTRPAEAAGFASLLGHLIGEVASPELLRLAASDHYVGSVPVRLIPPQVHVEGLDKLLLRAYALPITKVLKELRFRPDVREGHRGGASHPRRLVRDDGNTYTLSTNWGGYVPLDKVSELAAFLREPSAGAYCEKVLNPRRKRKQ